MNALPSSGPSRPPSSEWPTSLRFYTWGGALLWTVVVFGLVVFDIRQARNETLELTAHEAEANFDWDHATRVWASSHGGVWVPIDERTPPNPYLTNMLKELGKEKEQNMVSPGGVKLTLMNPAYLFRQMVEDYEKQYGIKGHLTSLKPIRPGNRPDEWERQALLRFEAGETSVMEISYIDGVEYLRLMRPEYVTKSCLNCHQTQGYKLGDIRGGISVSVPMTEHRAREQEVIAIALGTHSLLWLAGVLGIFGAARRLGNEGTQRREAEERLLRLAAGVEGSADAIYITDEDGAIRYVNPAFAKLTGYQFEEIEGMSPGLFRSEKHDPEGHLHIWETARSGRTWRGTTVNRKKGGEIYYADESLAPVLDDDAISGFVGIQRDASRELALDRAREYFTSVTSHEIRTPLTKLGMALSVLESGQALDDQSERGGHIRNALRESYNDLARIASATQIIARLNMMRANPQGQATPLLMTLTRTVVEARGGASAANRKVTIDADLNTLMPDTAVLSERDLLSRAFTEILSNAVKYTPDGGTVMVTAVYDDPHTVRISFRDQGGGIPEELVDQAMEPYTSLEDPVRHTSGQYKYRGGGLGLGLTVARLVAEYHRGSFHITSLPSGEGTDAEFVLPVRPL